MSDENQEATKVDKLEPAPQDQVVTTDHEITIDGRTIKYKAEAGTIVLHEEDDEGKVKPKATLFYTAYLRQDVEAHERPITFSFNGGPGSSSVWLHLGLLGPKRIDLGPDGHLPPPPYRVQENEYSLLDVTDLVFIDPVTTGYSRTVEGEKAGQFHDFEKDIESVGEFIRLYCTRKLRWPSAKFLIGESYGTTRAAGLSGLLQEKHGMYLNGIMLISSILNFQTVFFAPGNDLPYILYLPSYTATAWYHGRLSESLQADLYQALSEAEAFATGAYARALAQGSQLSAADRKDIAEQLSRFTGLSVDYVQRSNLRIEHLRFAKELLRDQRKTIGRLDSRFIATDRDSAGERFEFDPSFATILGPYTAAMNDYVRRDLGFESDLPYEILTGRVQPWSYEKFQNAYVDVAETLRKAFRFNPFLKVHIASGYFDLATPYQATKYTFAHLDLDEDLLENVSESFYEAGHMMYVHRPSLIKLKKELADFVAGASSDQR